MEPSRREPDSPGLWRAGSKRYDGRVFSLTSSSRPRFVRNLAVIALLTGVGSAPGSADEIDATLEAVYGELNIQRELTPLVVPNMPSGSFQIPAVFGWVILAAAATGAVCLALWLMAFDVDRAGAKRRRRRGRSQQKHGTDDIAEPASGDWLRDADDLARQGRFAEAIHRLLLGVLGKLGRPGTSNATTAREIVRAHIGPHAQRLGALVQASELVHFGGRPGTREQYDRCRLDAVELQGALDPVPG